MRVFGRPPSCAVFGFSPSADLTLTSRPSQSWSTVVAPQVFMGTASPPIGLPLPGLTITVVTPPEMASSNPMSWMSMASIARTPAVFGRVVSLVSVPATPFASSWMPMCTCASTRPAVTQRPSASMISRSLGGRSEPTDSMTPSRITTVPDCSSSPGCGTT